MSEGISEVGRQDTEIRKHVIEVLRKRERRALFVTELSASLREADGSNGSDIESRLQQDGFCGDLIIMQSNGGLSDISTA